MHIPRELIEVRVSRSGGAGGQHVNKTSSRVEIRFHVLSAQWLALRVRHRLHALFNNRITQDGFLVLVCDVHRSQHQNLDEAFDKLAEMIEQAAHIPKNRIATNPTRGSKKRRVDSKKNRSQTKKSRSWRPD